MKFLLLLLIPILSAAQITIKLNDRKVKSHFQIQNDTLNLKIENGDSFTFALVEIETKGQNNLRQYKKYSMKTNNENTWATLSILKMMGRSYIDIEMYNRKFNQLNYYKFY